MWLFLVQAVQRMHCRALKMRSAFPLEWNYARLR